MQNPEQSEQPNAPTDFPAYPTYKPSGVEWLGDIPAHWDAPMLKRVVRIINGATPSTLTPAYWNGNINWITPNDLGKLDTPYIETGERSISQQGYDSCGTRLAPAGSVVMSTRAPIGHVAILTAEACVNQGCRLIIPGKMIDSGFLYHQLKAFRNDLASFGQGSTFMELSQRNLGAFYITLPPLPEQRAIAAYLDRKGAIARRYAHVARHIIDTLRELRQVEIHDAVTRGLNEDIPLKPSGVEWLGDVPEHWDAPMLKRVVRIINGATPSTLTPAYWNGGINWITPNDLGKLDTPYIASGERSISQLGYDSCGTRLAPAGSVVMSTRAPIGHVAILTAEACVNQGCRLIIPKGAIDSSFLYYQLKAFRNDLASFGQGSTFMELSQRNLGAFHIALPPMDEQRAIAEYLDAKTAAIDAAIAHYERMAELVAEYWTVLVADAVTGRIDLRQTAAE